MGGRSAWAGKTRPDKPWRRPGAVRYALRRVPGLLRPPVDVYEPEPGSLTMLKDLPVTVRDGTTLRVNVVLPAGGGLFPALLSAHPYGKDNLPRRGRTGYRVSVQYRMLRQPARVRFSSLTGWEAPDPAWWAGQGYAVVNCDLRGAGTSEGTCAIWSDQHRDLAFPGGIRENGFIRMFGLALRGTRLRYKLTAEQRRRPLRDHWWRELVPALPDIMVPALICGSFSDNNLHTRGSFRGWERIESADRFLYTHRGGKWLTFYSPEARAAQLAFFDRYLRGRDVPAPPRIRLEVRESRDVVRSVRDERNWPLDGTEWWSLCLTGDGLAGTPPAEDGQLAFNTRTGGACWEWTVPAGTEITGPMALRIWVTARGTDDVSLFAGVEKWRGRNYVPFEGSYGFGRDRITTGWLKASLRGLDRGESRSFEPVPACNSPQPLEPGKVVAVDIALGPSATFFRAGDTLRLVVAGRWLWPLNPLTGQFPAAYETSPGGECTVHWGAGRQARLLIPVISGRETPRARSG